MNSPPASRNSTPKKVSQTNRHDAETVVPPEKTTTEDPLREKCTLLFALRAESEPKSLLNRVPTSPSIAEIVFQEEADKRLNHITLAIYPLVSPAGLRYYIVVGDMIE